MTTATETLEIGNAAPDATFQGHKLYTVGTLENAQGTSLMQTLVASVMEDDHQLELSHLEQENREIAVLLSTMTTCTELKAKTYAILEDVMAENSLRVVELKALLQAKK